MGKQGRFGKYGEAKRVARLRTARTAKARPQGIPSTPRSRSPAPVSARKPRISVRPAETADVPFIRKLSKTAFQQYGPYDTILPQWFQEGTTLTLLAQEDERAAGFVMLSRPAPDWALPHLCELLAIAVVPSRQRSGIGGVLLDKADAAAAGLRIDRIVLHTAVENTGAQSLFSRHGYVPVHIKKRFYSKGQNALMMVKALS